VKSDCIFCRIVAGEIGADVVSEDESTMTFLDRSPVFPGHLLVIPRRHVETLVELPDDQLQPLFQQVRRGSQAVETGLAAQGSFVAVNHKVSQTVPHLHVHVIPRSKGDGMKGFFWPRRHYKDDAQRMEIAEKLREAFRSL
jgi:histidine triad (HIT) family protein